MRLDGQRESDNVVDQRGGGGTGKLVLGGGGLVVVVLISLLTGRSPSDVVRQINGSEPSAAPSGPTPSLPTPAEEQAKHFTAKILATTEDAWREQFARMRKQYVPPQLVLFTNQVDSACGMADTAVGPFYCPRDQRAYLDLTFFAELAQRFGAPGDFAQAYVVAHEIGHHVQKLLGTSDYLESRGGKTAGATGTSVRVELQADCYAGVWGAYAQRHGLLDARDPQEAIAAAQAIGDDTLQRRGRGGRVAPDSFTHGTSAQRVKWFKRGMQSGDPAQCDTFRANPL